MKSKLFRCEKKGLCLLPKVFFLCVRLWSHDRSDWLHRVLVSVAGLCPMVGVPALHELISINGWFIMQQADLMGTRTDLVY